MTVHMPFKGNGHFQLFGACVAAVCNPLVICSMMSIKASHSVVCNIGQFAQWYPAFQVNFPFSSFQYILLNAESAAFGSLRRVSTNGPLLPYGGCRGFAGLFPTFGDRACNRRRSQFYALARGDGKAFYLYS